MSFSVLTSPIRKDGPSKVISGQPVVSLDWQKRCKYVFQHPPMPDEEILLMPDEELVRLYYGELVQWDPRASDWGGTSPVFRQSSVISKGMDGWEAEITEMALRSRIYRLRTDLHNVIDTSTGKTIPMLVDLSKIRTKPMITGGIGGEIFKGIVGAVLSIVPIGAVMSAAATVAQAKTTAKEAERAYRLYGTVGNAADVILNQRYVPVGMPLPGRVKNFETDFLDWSRRTLAGQQETILSLRKKYQDWMVSINEAIAHCGTVGWDPYVKFFYSDAVRDMVLNPQVQATQALTQQTDDGLIGAIGLGWLLLLLL